MTEPFNFSGINQIYVAACKADRKTIVVEVRNGIGIFVFMIFFSDHDDAKDRLFLYLARTAQMLELKMYGRHSTYEPENNKFEVYFNEKSQNSIREELGLTGMGRAFSFLEFLNALNNGIPQSLSLAELQRNCRAHRQAFARSELRKVVDDAHKVYLIGLKQLGPTQKPRENTLRKLYIHVTAEAAVLDNFIQKLKMQNKTLAWTDRQEYAHKSIGQIFDQF
ncbi:hypothetical protein ACOTH9_24030 [Achromobacter xylosoxidans]